MPINTQWLIPSQVAFILIPKVAGVYELGNRYVDGIIRTIYIGKAGTQNTLNSRIPQHFLKSEPNGLIKKYAQYFRYETNRYPDQREKELLEEFKRMNGGQLPFCNTQMPK